MCGIFGFVATPGAALDVERLDHLLQTLFLLSESRGKDSAGLVLADEARIRVYKRPERARKMIRSPQYREFVADYKQTSAADAAPVVAMGHARMVTNGRKEFHQNNQPVIKSGLVCIHNGIIVNDGALWETHTELERHYQVDTEVLLALVRHYLDQGCNVVDAVVQGMEETQGANSVALMFEERDGIVLATTNGSLYYAVSQDDSALVFASERYILEQTLAQPEMAASFARDAIQHVRPYEGYAFGFSDLMPHYFSLAAPDTTPTYDLPNGATRHIEDITAASTRFIDELPEVAPTRSYASNDTFVQRVNDAVAKLQRCQRCILPETFPFITFDANGVCNFCNSYEANQFKGEDALREALGLNDPAASRRILVPISGGRDSSYTLHYVKEVLGMEPVAYTYDWGLVTDLARRNISRMCGALGVEHILISADIKMKRENVRKNVVAWLRRPELGMIPLFMAGDKQFFRYSNMLKKQMNIGMSLFGINPLERTDFKYGFAGVDKDDDDGRFYYSLPFMKGLRFTSYYALEFLKNPTYLNTSVIDTLDGFISYYVIPKDYEILFEYVRWEEKTVEEVLLGTYDWETSPDTETTWRIGDGTAPFYNYIYYTAAGFSENDTFRSNQIREGMIAREEALRVAARDNQPRYKSMLWYADTIGFDFDAALEAINAMPKRFEI